MTKKEDTNTRVQAQVPMKEFEIQDVFRGANTSESELNKYTQDAIANTVDAKAEILKEMVRKDAIVKASQDVVDELKYYSERLTTGFDIRKATFIQKTEYNLASLIPWSEWRESVKKSVATSQKLDVVDNLQIAYKKLGDLTATIDNIVTEAGTQHGKLRNLAKNDYAVQQKTAITKMNDYILKITDYNGQLDNLNEVLLQLKDKEPEESDKQKSSILFDQIIFVILFSTTYFDSHYFHRYLQ